MPGLFRWTLGVGFSLAAAELWVRPVYDMAVVYEPGIGYVNAPGRHHFGLEGSATSTWLAHGVRVTPDAASDGKTVLVLGDSFTEALMIEDAATFPSVAARDLARRGSPVRLVNAGRSTMSCADYVHLAPRYRELFAPDWVVIEVRGDDFAQDAWAAGRTRFSQDEQSQLQVEGVIEPERRGLRGALFKLRQESMLVGYGVVRAGKFRTVPEPPLFQAGRKEPPRLVPPEPPVEAEIDMLAKAWAGRMTLLYLSEYLDADAIEPRVRAHCQTRRLSCAFTREANEQLRPAGKAPTGFTNTGWGTGHLNSDGHRIAGEVLAAELDRAQRTEEKR